MNFFIDLWFAFANGILSISYFFINHWWWLFGFILIGVLVYFECQEINENIIDEDRDLM